MPTSNDYDTFIPYIGTYYILYSVTITPLNQSLRGNERKKTDKFNYIQNLNARQKRNHQPSQTSDSLGKYLQHVTEKELILLIYKKTPTKKRKRPN